MMHNSKKLRSGLTLIELVMAASICMIVVLVTGILLVSSQRNWNQAFNKANKGIQVDAQQTMITFGTIGRKSNKVDYRVYTVTGGKFLRTLPATSSPADGQILLGDAVEFRYWDTALSASLLDNAKTATAYVLFYLDGTTLKVDQGPYLPGGVSSAGVRTLPSGGTTRVVAEHVTSLKFSHTAKDTQGNGDGCVRMDIGFRDPDNNTQTITLKTATLMRNTWGIPQS
jgi:hypothetical protein